MAVTGLKCQLLAVCCDRARAELLPSYHSFINIEPVFGTATMPQISTFFRQADVISAHVMLLQIKTGQYSVQPPPGLGKQWVDILGIIDSSQHACHLATILSNKLFCCLTHLSCMCSCSVELDTSTDCVVMPRTLAVRTHLHLSLQTETKDTNLWVINCFPRMFL